MTDRGTEWRRRQALHARASARAGVFVAAIALATLTSCGGSGNALDNPPNVNNPGTQSGQRLSFAYFQRCINPIYLTNIAGTTCAGAGCHDNAQGTGGALRVFPSAAPIDVTNPANTPDSIRQSDMYKNFYSSQGVTVIGQPNDSRLLNKPLVRGTLHGGGTIFLNDQDPNARRIIYWISRPAPAGQDEFSPATYSMFTPADPNAGTCNTQ